MSVRHFLPLLFLLAQAALAAAAGPLQLLPAQMQALGVRTEVVGDHVAARGGALPARVLVPNGQLRIVAAPVGGRVEMLAVAPGSPVRRGQIVARLASPQALELQRDALQSASQLALAQQTLKRDEQLFAEGLIAESRLQASRATAAQAAAQSGERRQGLALAGIVPGTLGGPLALTAPIDGVVLEQSAQIGQRVETAAPIYRIAQLSPLWLEIQAPLELAAGLREGMPVKVVDSDVTGRLVAVGRAVDPASQTVLLRAEVGPGADKLTPGQAVAAELPAAARGLLLPAAALVRHDGKDLVFVQTGDDARGVRFEARPVRVLGQGGDGVAVDGVKAGERVAIRGVSGLKAIVAGVGRD